jgi:hypothetical protein
MKLAKLIQFLRNRLKTVVWVSYAILALVVIMDAIPAIVDKEHAHTAAEHWFAFWAAFGLLGCGALVLFSKLYGHYFVSRSEDYYDE